MSMFRCVTSRRALCRLNSYNLRTHAYHPTAFPTPTARCFSNTALSCFPRKDTQDKDSLTPTSTEYSKSGSDDATAGTDAAFDPSTTSPEAQENQARKESGGEKNNPLNASPGNEEVSKPRPEGEGGADNSPKTSSGTGGGSAPKAGGNKSG